VKLRSNPKASGVTYGVLSGKFRLVSNATGDGPLVLSSKTSVCFAPHHRNQT
jgi:nitroimidazol reductase NimA-like FMN-containing flavoprotein (pyridoxamine 5'-phosphate oxidase superfamily)